MKRVTFLSLILLLTISCTLTKEPEFLGVKGMTLDKLTLDTISVTTTSLFKNLNDIGGTFSTEDIEVFVGDKVVAQVKSEEFKAGANKEFELPLRVQVPYNKLFEKNVLKGLLGSIFGVRTVKLRFKGIINYKIIGIKRAYKLDYVQELKLEKWNSDENTSKEQ